MRRGLAQRESRTLASAATASSRAGLAPLELALVLPLLLFLLFLMINSGAGIGAKLDAVVASREAAWRARWPRSPYNDPPPASWPAPAQRFDSPGGRAVALADPAYDRPVVRGTDPSRSFPTNGDPFDPTGGMSRGDSPLILGHASAQRDFPVMKRLGPFSLHEARPLLDDAWRYCPTLPIGGNYLRRIEVLYRLPRFPREAQRFRVAYLALVWNPSKPDLAPLDHDIDFIKWTGAAPDFIPVVNPQAPDRNFPFRDVDVRRVRRKYIDDFDGLIDRILRVPKRMADAFYNLYRSIQRQLDAMENILNDPLASADAKAGARAEIDRIHRLFPYWAEFPTWIDQLNRYRGTLP